MYLIVFVLYCLLLLSLTFLVIQPLGCERDINKLLLIKTPRALLNTVWINNCIYFGVRPGQEQRDLCWRDLELKTNADGLRLLAWDKNGRIPAVSKAHLLEFYGVRHLRDWKMAKFVSQCP